MPRTLIAVAAAPQKISLQGAEGDSHHSSQICRLCIRPTPGEFGNCGDYFAQQDKQGAIIDERFNGRGSAADYIIDVLQRDSDGYFNNTAGGRYPFTSPAAGIWGPKVMIVNEMAERQNYVATFTNRYGEEWLFEYDYRIREGILKGSDVNWQSYRVIGGRTLGLILNNEELQWLREVWAEATSTWSACGAAPAGMPARKIVGRNACSAVRSLAATCRRRLMACRGVLRLSADRSVSTMGS